MKHALRQILTWSILMSAGPLAASELETTEFKIDELRLLMPLPSKGRLTKEMPGMDAPAITNVSTRSIAKSPYYILHNTWEWRGIPQNLNLIGGMTIEIKLVQMDDPESAVCFEGLRAAIQGAVESQRSQVEEQIAAAKRQFPGLKNSEAGRIEYKIDNEPVMVGNVSAIHYLVTTRDARFLTWTRNTSEHFAVPVSGSWYLDLMFSFEDGDSSRNKGEWHQEALRTRESIVQGAKFSGSVAAISSCRR